MEFNAYMPILQGFLNPINQKVKTWKDVVYLFFQINSDEKMRSLSDMALAFNNAGYPDYFHISIRLLEQSFKFVNEEYLKTNCIEDKDYISDQFGIRLTFNTFRRIVIIHDYAKYELIDRFYQSYVRYERCVSSRIKTHWTLIEQLDSFKPAMKPHESTSKLMDTQPRVFRFLYGTNKTINELVTKTLMKESPRYEIIYCIAIYESVAPNIKDETSALINYITTKFVNPFIESQIDNDVSSKKGTKAKLNVRFIKDYILIDPLQDVFNEQTLSSSIEDVRENLKSGLYISTSGHIENTSDESNFTSIEMYNQTNGQFFDNLKMFDLMANDRTKQRSSSMTSTTTISRSRSSTLSTNSLLTDGYVDSEYDCQYINDDSYNSDQDNATESKKEVANKTIKVESVKSTKKTSRVRAKTADEDQLKNVTTKKTARSRSKTIDTTTEVANVSKPTILKKASRSQSTDARNGQVDNKAKRSVSFNNLATVFSASESDHSNSEDEQKSQHSSMTETEESYIGGVPSAKTLLNETKKYLRKARKEARDNDNEYSSEEEREEEEEFTPPTQSIAHSPLAPMNV